jgi:fructokinase
VKRFNQCVEVADIIKFSDQRTKDVEQFEGYKDKLFIQTQGARGLNYRLNSGWKHLAPVANDKVVDTAGAGDIGVYV